MQKSISWQQALLPFRLHHSSYSSRLYHFLRHVCCAGGIEDSVSYWHLTFRVLSKMPKRGMCLTFPASVIVSCWYFLLLRLQVSLGKKKEKIICDDWLVSVCLYNFKPSYSSLAKHFQKCHSLWLQMNWCKTMYLLFATLLLSFSFLKLLLLYLSQPDCLPKHWICQNQVQQRLSDMYNLVMGPSDPAPPEISWLKFFVMTHRYDLPVFTWMTSHYTCQIAGQIVSCSALLYWSWGSTDECHAIFASNWL